MSELTKAVQNIAQEANRSKDAVAKNLSSKATSIIKKSTSKYTDNNPITSIDLSNYILTNYTGEISKSVTKLIDKSVDEIVKEELDLVNRRIDSSNIGEEYSQIKSTYSKIYNSDKLMAGMREKYTASMTKSIESIVNKQTKKLTNNKLLGKILVDSKLSEKITGQINSMVVSAINQMCSDEIIKGVTEPVKKTVTDMKKKAKSYLETNLKSEIEYANKLKTAVQDKIKVFEEQRKKLIDSAIAYATKLKNMVSDYIKKVTTAISESLQSAVKGMAGSIKF